MYKIKIKFNDFKTKYFKSRNVEDSDIKRINKSFRKAIETETSCTQNLNVQLRYFFYFVFGVASTFMILCILFCIWAYFDNNFLEALDKDRIVAKLIFTLGMTSWFYYIFKMMLKEKKIVSSKNRQTVLEGVLVKEDIDIDDIKSIEILISLIKKGKTQKRNATPVEKMLYKMFSKIWQPLTLSIVSAAFSIYVFKDKEVTMEVILKRLMSSPSILLEVTTFVITLIVIIILLGKIMHNVVPELDGEFELLQDEIEKMHNNLLYNKAKRQQIFTLHG